MHLHFVPRTGLHDDMRRSRSFHHSKLHKKQSVVPPELAMQLASRRQVLMENPDLLERRVAMAKAAFVKHDTLDMVDAARQGRVGHSAAGTGASGSQPELLKPVAVQHGNKSSFTGECSVTWWFVIAFRPVRPILQCLTAGPRAAACYVRLSAQLAFKHVWLTLPLADCSTSTWACQAAGTG
jgi:hypothetical protein